jgi:hypothetical protein
MFEGGEEGLIYISSSLNDKKYILDKGQILLYHETPKYKTLYRNRNICEVFHGFHYTIFPSPQNTFLYVNPKNMYKEINLCIDMHT